MGGLASTLDVSAAMSEPLTAILTKEDANHELPQKS